MNKEERIKAGYTGKIKETVPGENRVVTIDRDNPEEYGVLTIEEAIKVGAIRLPKNFKLEKKFTDQELEEKLLKDYNECIQD